MRALKVFILGLLFAWPLVLLADDMVPPGTILPVGLTSTVDSNAASGTVVHARITQNVPLSNGHVLRAGTKVTGHVVDSRQSKPGQLALRFDTVEVPGNPVSIRANLRAIADVMEIEQASIPAFGPDKGTPASAWTTVQIGGDVVYRGGGPVTHGDDTVGRPVNDGVLVRVSAAGQCRGEVDGNSNLQALWLFSSDACGVYGIRDTSVLHAGRTDPVGTIVFASAKGHLKLLKGTGMLLRVHEVPQTSADAHP